MSKAIFGVAAAALLAIGSATAAPFGHSGWMASSGGGSHRAAADQPGLLQWLQTFLMIAPKEDAAAGAGACKEEAGAAVSASARSTKPEKDAPRKAPAGSIAMQKAPQPLPLAF